MTVPTLCPGHLVGWPSLVHDEVSIQQNGARRLRFQVKDNLRSIERRLLSAHLIVGCIGVRMRLTR